MKVFQIPRASTTRHAPASSARRRSWRSMPSQKTSPNIEESETQQTPRHLHDKQVIIVVESEGAVFDVHRRWHESAYLPAFIGCFGGMTEPALCGEVWRHVALETSLRGEPPMLILLSALRVLNSLVPSVQRTVIIKSLEKYASSEAGTDDLFRLEEKNPAEMMAIDWFSMAEGLIQDSGRVPYFSTAEEFLRNAAYIAPNSKILVYSSLLEQTAMRLWQSAGLGECFFRIAGRERGSPSQYLRSALASGFERSSMVAVGSSAMMFKASQLAGIRFFPIVPDQEEESWKMFAEEWFPAFLRGDSWKADSGAERFYELACREFNVKEAAEEIRKRIKI